jgi:hypothetical protein
MVGIRFEEVKAKYTSQTCKCGYRKKLGFAKLPPSGGIASAYVGTSVPFKEQGLGSYTCQRQIPET